MIVSGLACIPNTVNGYDLRVKYYYSKKVRKIWEFYSRFSSS